MKCIILAAGYATRLYPLTINTPKPLLTVAGKTILDFLIEKVEEIDKVDVIYIISNDRFYQHFLEWQKGTNYSKAINVINDGTIDNDTRLGAIADIQFVIDEQKVSDDLLVIAGDNLFDFELSDFALFFESKDADCITTHEINDIERIKRTGVIQLNEDNQVICFEEKPKKPKSNLAVPPFYLYKKDTLKLIREYLDSGNNPDAPGNFVPWLIGKKSVYAYKFEGQRYDIGTLESYEEVQKLF